MSCSVFLPNLDLICHLSYHLATVEPFKNKIVDHTSADQGKIHISWGCCYYFCEFYIFIFCTIMISQFRSSVINLQTSSLKICHQIQNLSENLSVVAMNIQFHLFVKNWHIFPEVDNLHLGQNYLLLNAILDYYLDYLKGHIMVAQRVLLLFHQVQCTPQDYTPLIVAAAAFLPMQ